LGLRAVASAQIDSGGGKSSGGTFSNHASLGESFATLSTQIGTATNHPGLIEVLYPITPFSITDVGGNGLPDGWEISHFGNYSVDPSADSDFDTTSNLLEYLAGTDPINAASLFRPEGNFINGIYHLPLPTIKGRDYQVWVTRDLANWVLQSTYAGDGTEKLFTFDEATILSGPLYSPSHSSHYFFRVNILVP
jgi:hypothetical protein